MAGLRFCSLTTFYPPFNFGGDGIDVQRTARALAARGHHVTVIHDVDAYQWLSSHQLPEQPVEQDGVHVIGLRSKLGVISPLLTHQLGRPVVHGRRLREIVDKGAFDVVLFNNVSLVGGPELLRLGNGSLRSGSRGDHGSHQTQSATRKALLQTPTAAARVPSDPPPDNLECGFPFLH